MIKQIKTTKILYLLRFNVEIYMILILEKLLFVGVHLIL